MLPSHTDLEYFIEVATAKNVSRAAERLGISQPSLSVALKRLEAIFGTPLLIREKTGVQLTRAGESLAKGAQSWLLNWESLRSEVLQSQQEVSGRFSLGCHVSVARYALPAILPGLFKTHPKLEIALVHDLSRKITERIVSYEIDFGIVVNPVSHLDLVILPLCNDRVTFWSKTGEMMPTLLYDPSLHQTEWVLQKLEKSGTRFERMVSSQSLEVLADLASQGLGAAILPTRVAERASARLLPVGKHAPFFEDKVCFVYRADRQTSAAAKAVIRAVRAAKV